MSKLIWPEFHIEVLKRNYSKLGPTGMQSVLPEHTKDSIRHKARKLGLIYTPVKGEPKPKIQKPKVIDSRDGIMPVSSVFHYAQTI